MRTIKARLVAREKEGKVDAVKAKRLITTQKDDGSWDDVDYADKGRSSWGPVGHMGHLHSIAKLRAYEGDKADDASLRALEKGLVYWYEKDLTCPNWWYNVIGIPRILYRVLLLTENDLDKEMITRAQPILKRAKLGMTGQNLVWVAECTIARGCLIGDPEVVAEAFQRIANEIRVSSSEGIQADWSFWQHGAQLYSGGYGRGFSVDCPRFAALARGTVFAFSPETIDVLSSYILDGQQWMVRGQTFDYSACGREITRKGAGTSTSLIRACRDMASLETERKEEFNRFAECIALGEHSGTQEITGHRHFWRSEFSVHHTPELYMSVRLASKRVAQTETCNSENLLGLHLSDGVTYLMRRGDEYKGIFPVWDWKRLPGITVVLDGKVPKTWGKSIGTTFAGGVSDGVGGVSAMNFSRSKMSARKAWFFLGGRIVCLGSGIRSEAAAPVITSVNQCWRKGDIVIGSVSSASFTGSVSRRSLPAQGWVHHDGILYSFSGAQRAVVEAANQSGSWRRINRNYPDTQIEAPVFSLWLEHGSEPQAEKYAYAVESVDTQPESANEQLWLDVEILRNDPAVQSVYSVSERSCGIVFYSGDTIQIPGLGSVTAEQPCLVYLRVTEGGLEISMSNPENAAGNFGLTTSFALAGGGAVRDKDGTRLCFDLPDGLYAGQSVVRTFQPGNTSQVR